ncbi:2-oxo acid dehydrogenase subunit E2 [Klebsiella sp. BIGb0407]|uniref:2-oxo acid dehydrogenase subunit E2 n=1 Tax=Klebsiella sp. BIGb0407 TaxID=2940603 RepID=UPI0021695F68|nr:2-oxo acid dehydrogenase subunit E2 [Klebsiella sp. BIGb0407]MCS3429836.1 pyruvate dehydrogenase E2 component (dihydrolipoamide acetyltransferase) [Klebsiella sp. BIGb0407]
MPETRHTASAESIVSRTHYASPLVYRLARERKVDLQQLTGTARQGRISQDDIMRFLQSAPDTRQTRPETAGQIAEHFDFSPFGATARKSLTPIQKIAASRLSRNGLTIPHVTYHDEADITDLETLRVSWNSENSVPEFNITQQAFLLKASAAALIAFPELNSSLDMDNGELILKKYLNIGFTVATPEGDIIPVIRDVASKRVAQLAQEMAILNHKAEDGTLSNADISGGCFTLYSLEGIGGLAFTPIINGSEVAILGISASRLTEKNRMILPLSLSYDNRVISHTTAARFMAHLKNLLNDIRLLLL